MKYLHSSLTFMLENFHDLIPTKGLFYRKYDNPKRFFILMHGRSGSSLLVSLLDSHPAIKCSGEIFNRPRQYPHQLILGLEKYYRFRKGYDIAWGFKAKPEQIEVCGIKCESFLAYLVERKTKIISLVRDNIFHSSVSVLLAGKRGGKFHHNSNKNEKYTPVILNPEQVFAVMEQRQFQKEKIKAAISCLPVEVLQLTYEENLSDFHQQNSTCSLIFDFLNIKNLQAITNFKKITTNNLSDSVINAEEVVNFIAGSKFSKYVDGITI